MLFRSTIRALLPAGFTPGGSYRTLLMHDGQNLMNPDAAWGGWRMDEALADPAWADVVLLAVDNASDRFEAYTHTIDTIDGEVYGGQAKTPNLNQLAKQGLKFTRCFQTAPMCSPTRHNIYTGLYPVRSGAWPNHTCVYPGTKSIAHYLKDSGYRVALSGKTHISPRESFPFEYSDDFRKHGPET